MHAGIHQLIAAAALDLDDEILAIFVQAQRTTVFRNGGCADQDETFHGHLYKEGGSEPESGAANAAAKNVARMRGGGDRCGSLSWTGGGLKEKPARPGPDPALQVQALRACLRWAMSPIIC
ncbi:hypothetical protein ACFSHR_20725 [Azotobacter chroococcum]